MDQFLTYKKGNLGPVFNFTAYIYSADLGSVQTTGAVPAPISQALHACGGNGPANLFCAALLAGCASLLSKTSDRSGNQTETPRR